jgi:inositol-phosphate phosphatase/L-galactose 1-phosphate phosphatase/histidinol-phosphatase
MENLNITELKKFITDIIYSSGDIAKKYFRANIAQETKEDFSPVTLADKEIEDFLRSKIAEKYPSHLICGEELGYELGENAQKAKYKWYIDPIDGTASFIGGRPLFTTLLALVIDEKPAFSAVYQPITNELWFGVDFEGELSASFNDKPIEVSKTTDIDKSMIATTSPDLFGIEGYGIFSKAKEKAAITVFGGDAYNYMMLAMGRIDAVIEEGLKPHDFCALVPIIKGAGGIAKNFNGEEVDVNIVQSLLATSSQTLFETIKKFGD